MKAGYLRVISHVPGLSLQSPFLYPANFAGVRRRPQTLAQKIVSVCARRFSGGGSCI